MEFLVLLQISNFTSDNHIGSPQILYGLIMKTPGTSGLNAKYLLTLILLQIMCRKNLIQINTDRGLLKASPIKWRVQLGRLTISTS